MNGNVPDHCGVASPGRAPARSLAWVGLLVSLLWCGPAFALSGSVSPVTFTGPLTRQSVTFNIYLPQGYATSTTRYPVLYQLHGNTGSPYSDNDSLGTALEHAVAGGIIGPMIIVFPDGYGNSMWADSYDMAKPAETNVTREVIPYVDAQYRTIASHKARVIEGMSMGGFGCLDYAYKFTGLWSCAVCYAAAIDDTWQTADQDHPGIFNASEVYFDLYSPWVNLPINVSAIRASMPLRMLVGTVDPLMSYNQQMRDNLTSSSIPVSYVEVPGVAHDFAGLLAAEGDNSFAFIAKHLDLGAATDPSNAVPVANAQNVSTAQNTAVAITLSATDADGDALTYAIASNPQHGTLTGSGETRTDTPTSGYTGADGFTFEARDAKSVSNRPTVSISVGGAGAGTGGATGSGGANSGGGGGTGNGGSGGSAAGGGGSLGSAGATAGAAAGVDDSTKPGNQPGGCGCRVAESAASDMGRSIAATVLLAFALVRRRTR